MSGRRNVSYVAQEEPNFLKQFKQKIGYKEEPGIDAKRRTVPDDHWDDDEDEERPETEEERPQVVVLKTGDLTAEEAEKFNCTKDADPATLEKKVVFKKPSKRSTEETSIFKPNSSKRTKNSDDANPSSDSNKRKTDSGKKLTNTKLLSFENEDDDE